PILNDFTSKKLNKIVPELKKVKPKVKSMISEINYKPGENNQNRIQMFMTDNVEVVGDIQTFANKINYYPSISDKLERDNTGELKTPGFVDLQVGATFLPYESKEQQKERANKESEQEENTKSEQQKIKQELKDLSKKIEKTYKKKKKENNTIKKKKKKKQKKERKKKENKKKENTKSEQQKLDQALQDLSKELEKSDEEPKSTEKSSD